LQWPLTSRQGHIEAAEKVGSIYGFGQGAAIDYPRAMAAYKVGAEGGDTGCQTQVGCMYYKGRGVEVDYTQALAWVEKATAQDDPEAACTLGTMYYNGAGVTPSWRRAREYFTRAIELGNFQAMQNMQTLTKEIQEVMSERSNHLATSLAYTTWHIYHPLHSSSLHTCSTPPSWTSGWRSTARAART
jgi:TPR repeat protein